MSERKWLSSKKPDDMLGAVIAKWKRRKGQGLAVDFERLRWYAVATCRRIWHLLPEDSQEALDRVEEFCRSRDSAVLEAARKQSWDATMRMSRECTGTRQDTPEDHAVNHHKNARNFASSAVWQTTKNKAAHAVKCRSEVCIALGESAQSRAYLEGIDDHEAEDKLAKRDERVYQTGLLREIVGNPYRRVTVEREWLTPTVVAMLRAIDEERSFADLPILADALEDSGCCCSDILEHCRSDEDHVRGCWVVETLLAES